MNKPYLPLASGDFSFALGQTLVVLCGATALALGARESHARCSRAAALITSADTCRLCRQLATADDNTRVLVRGSAHRRAMFSKADIVCASFLAPVSLVLGLFYSADVPLMRWKRSPFLAAACIFGVRALAVQFGFYFHMMTTVLHRCDASSAVQLLPAPGTRRERHDGADTFARLPPQRSRSVVPATVCQRLHVHLLGCHRVLQGHS